MKCPRCLHEMENATGSDGYCPRCNITWNRIAHAEIEIPIRIDKSKAKTVDWLTGSLIKNWRGSKRNGKGETLVWRKGWKDNTLAVRRRLTRQGQSIISMTARVAESLDLRWLMELHTMSIG